MDKDKQSILLHGKPLPQAVETEQSVLGSILVAPENLNDCVDILRPEMFYHDRHAWIYEAMMILYKKSMPIDIFTLTEELMVAGRLQKCGGSSYLNELTSLVGSVANVRYHAAIVAQKYIERKIIEESHESIKKAYEGTYDVFDLHSDACKRLEVITEFLAGEVQHIKSSVMQILNQDPAEVKAAGSASGFSDHDSYFGVFEPKELIIIGARASMGKTAFALALAKNAALLYKEPVAIFSLEMGAIQLAKRLLAAESNVPIYQISNQTTDKEAWDKIIDGADRLVAAPIYIDDTAGLDITDFKAKSRRLKKKYGIKMIIVDYLQLMTSRDRKNQNREQEISAISRGLKLVAKELDVKIVALSQINRSVEHRGEKKPTLADLRESGSIEQDADRVYFLFRPEYYGIAQTSDGMSTAGMVEVIVAKHRNGPTGPFNLEFIKETNEFRDFGKPKWEQVQRNPAEPSNSNDDLPF